MPTLPYNVVDVFTTNALEGNPLAVFPEDHGLDTPTMQAIARELNLSETVFLVPASRPDCVARLRIFTPRNEMDFAGHPTVGSVFVLIARKIATATNFAVEENVGPVPIRVEPGNRPLIWLTTPPIKHGPALNREVCATALGLNGDDLLNIEPQLFSAGNPNIFIALKSKDAVDRAALDTSGMRRMKAGAPEAHCVFVFAPTPEGAYSRMFAPEFGVAEDPATGSATGPLAAYMIHHGLVSGAPGTRFISEQGTKMGRRSLLHVQVNDGSIEVGGHVTPIVEAVMRF